MKCLCNCNNEPKPGNRYIHGHNTARPKLQLKDALTRRDPTTGCLLFLGSVNPVSGYGHLGHRYAHRVAYEETYGPIPPGMSIDHVYARGCRHRNCVEPAHLEAVTPAENTRRASALRTPRKLCKYGHALSGQNLRIVKHHGRGERQCVTCARRRALAYYHRKAA